MIDELGHQATEWIAVQWPGWVGGIDGIGGIGGIGGSDGTAVGGRAPPRLMPGTVKGDGVEKFGTPALSDNPLFIGTSGVMEVIGVSVLGVIGLILVIGVSDNGSDADSG
jgi:hypothetical protein